MKIAVWKTGHEIANTVTDAVLFGLHLSNEFILCSDVSRLEIIDQYDIHIGYGILRGMDKVFRACNKAGKPWFCIDRGYWKPGHYDGYYRISLGGTQQTFGLDKLKPDYEKWDRLGIEIDEKPLPYCRTKILVCPPTDYVAPFYNTTTEHWSIMNAGNTPEYLFRQKGCERGLQSDLNGCNQVITFNSSVGWEALRQGIPVVSDPNHSIVGAYQKMLDKPLWNDSNARREFFSILASLQLTLPEIRDGHLWQLLVKLLTISGSAGTAVKP